MASTGWVTLKSGQSTTSSIGYFTTDSTQAVFTISGASIAENTFSDDKETVEAQGLTGLEVNGQNVTFTAPAIDTTTQITISGGAKYNFTFNNQANALRTGTIEGAEFTGSTGNDTLVANDITVESGAFQIKGNAGNDLITASNISQPNAGTAFSLFGGAGEDTITLDGVTVGGGVLFVDGDSDADVISLSNISQPNAGPAISVFGGEGADTITLDGVTVGGGILFVDGGSDSDVISLSQVSLSADVLSVIGGEGNDSIAIKNSTLPTAAFFITGDDGNDTISFDTVSISGDKTISLGAGNDVLSFEKLNGHTGGNLSVYSGLGNDSIAITNSTLNGYGIQLLGDGGQDTVSIDTVTLQSGARISIQGSTDSDNTVFIKNTTFNDGGITVIGGEENNTFEVQNVTMSSSNPANIISIKSGKGNDSFSVSNVILGGTETQGSAINMITGAGNDTVFVENATLNTASININRKADIAAGNNYVTVQAVKLQDSEIEIHGGSEVDNVYLDNISFADKSTSTISLNEGNDILSLSNITVSGDGSFTVNTGDGADTISLSNIELASGAKFAVYGKGSTASLDSDLFNIGEKVSGISIISGDTDSDTFNFESGAAGIVTISGLGATDKISIANYTGTGASLGNGVFVLDKVTIATEYDNNASIASKGLYDIKVFGKDNNSTLLGDLIDKIEWHARTDSSVAAYGRQFGETSDTIVISGLASVTSQVATLNAGKYIDGTFVTFDSDVLITAQTTPITLTSSTYHAALDDDSKVVFNPESYSTISATSVAYKSANTVAGYSVVAGSGSDTINYIAAADSEATISGLATDFDLSAIQFGDNVFTISAAALGTNSNTPVTLNTAAGYTLTVGADVSGSDTRAAYWLADASIATFYAGQGTVAGYNVAADKKSIVYTAQANSTKTIEISGLKGISASNNSIAGISLDSTTSSVTIAKTIIDTAGASIKEGAGYNYALGGKGALISNISAGGVTLTGSTSNDSLTNKGGASVLEGGKGNDVIVAGAGGDTISAGVGNDSITLGAKADSVFYSGGNDVIFNYGANDTITLDSTKSVREASFDSTTNDLTVKLNSGKITFKNAKDTEIAVGGNIYKNNLVYNADKTELTLNKSATSLSADDITASIKSIDASNVSTGLTITSKNTTETTILGGKGTDYLTGAAGADSLDGGNGNDTLNGGAGNDTLTGDKGDDVFIYSGGKDVITDYGTGKDIINISNAASVVADSSVDSDGNVILTFDSDNTLTLTKANGAVVSMTSGSSSVVSAQIYGNHSTMNTKKTGVTLGADYNDSQNSFDATSYSSMITIDGSAVTANTKLTGNAKANKIYGGDGNDMLIGGAGNDTLTGNAGSDTFVYSTGKDVITDFDAAADKISLTAEGGVTAITNATYSGDASDTLILTINKQTLKIEADKDASLAGKSISINDKAYTFDKNLINDGTSVTMYSAFKGTYTAADGITNVNGSAANGAMSITGTSAGDTLYGGKKADTLNGGAGADSINGGAGNDSIYGGAGKDTLFGGAGKDIFVFGANEGEDIIEDYTAGEDKIKLINGAEITATAQSSLADIEFTIGTSGKVIVKNAAGSAITVIDANGKTTTQIYGGSSSSSRTLDLLYDNNFMTDDAALDDITEAKYSVTDIETDSKDELEKAQALLTYSKDK